MEILEQIGVLLDGLFITLVLIWVGWGFCHEIGVWLGGLERELDNDGESDHGGQVDGGGDSSGCDFGGGFGGFGL